MPAPTSLIQAMLPQADQFNFYRFCQLMELASKPPCTLAGSDSVATEPVRFRSHPAYGFPVSELHYQPEPYSDTLQPVPAVYTRFLGLTGVDGVLPQHIGNDQVTRREGHEALTDFLDLFHHRIITRYYAIWRKYHYPAGFRPGGQDRLSQALLGLAGRALPGQQTGLSPARWLALLGPLSQRTRTAHGLLAAVQHVLPDTTGSVQPHYPRKVLLGAGRLGRATRLHRGTVLLGARLRDVQRTVKLTLHLQHSAELGQLQAGQQTHDDLCQVLRAYLGLRWDLALFASLPTAAWPATRLSRHSHRLGRAAHLPAPAKATPGQLADIPLGMLHA